MCGHKREFVGKNHWLFSIYRKQSRTHSNNFRKSGWNGKQIKYKLFFMGQSLWSGLLRKKCLCFWNINDLNEKVKGWINDGSIQIDTLEGIELLNEPAGFYEWVWNVCKDRFYYDGYEKIREAFPDPENMLVSIQQAFRGYGDFNGFMPHDVKFYSLKSTSYKKGIRKSSKIHIKIPFLLGSGPYILRGRVQITWTNEGGGELLRWPQHLITAICKKCPHRREGGVKIALTPFHVVSSRPTN